MALGALRVTTAVTLAGLAVAAVGVGLKWNAKPGGGAPPAPAGSRHMGEWFVEYQRPLAPPAKLSVMVTAAYGCIVRVTGPVDALGLHDRAEIGEYRGALPDEEAEALRAQAGPAILAARAPAEALDTGESLVTLSSGEIGKPADKNGFVPLSAPPPPEVARFEKSMLDLARLLVAHPFAVLKGKAASAWKDGAPEVTLDIENPGSATAECANPAAGAQALPLQLVLQREVPDDQLEPDDTVMFALAAGEAAQTGRGAPARGQAAPPHLRLAHGERATFVLRPQRHLRLSPGRYAVRVVASFADVPGGTGTTAVTGSLYVPAGTLQVGGK